MKKKRQSSMYEVTFWLAVPITVMLSWVAVTIGPSVEGGQALGRAAVAGAVGVIAYLFCPEEEI